MKTRISIIESPNLTEFSKSTDSIDSKNKTLVLFDVDETLIISKDLVFRQCVRNVWNKYAKDILEHPDISPYWNYSEEHLVSLVLSKIEYEIVDIRIVSLVHSLQQRNIKTIAFSRMKTGSFGIIPSMEDWRIHCLRKHNFNFSSAFPQIQELKFNALGYPKEPSLFKKGLLCADNQDKGPVLSAFLERIQWMPSEILFIDDCLDYLNSVKAVCKGHGINFKGFHYKEMESRPSILDESLVKFQLMHLIKTGKWLTDSMALNFLKS